MAIGILTAARVLVDGWDLSGDLNKVALSYGAELQDATTFANQGGKARKGGLKTIGLALEGFWDGGTDLADEVLFGKVNLVDVPVTVVPSAGLEGDRGFSFLASVSQYAPGGAIGEMLKFSLDAEGSGGDALARGILVHNATRTGNGSGTAFNQGLVGTGQKLYAVLHVLAIAGGGTWTLKIQSDDAQGFASPTDRITFAAVTAKGSQWATPVAGPIAADTWWRASWSVAGGAGNSITFAILLAIQ